MAREWARRIHVIGHDKRQLLLRHCAGDKNAFAELVSSLNAEVFSYLVRCGISESDRDDIFQEIFFTVHRSAKKYDPELPLEPWIFTIVVNTVRDYFRKKKRSREEISPPSFEQVDSSPNPHDISEARATAKWLESELAILPLEQREAIVLTYVKDMAQEEAAQALGIPLNTMKTHLRRGRLTLIERLKHHTQLLSSEVQ